MPRKKVVKKPIKQKQKQKQNVNVKQNVKVVIGDVKRKKAVKSSGPKAPAKPPIVLNISNPQPYNNPYMMYFRDQLQNQQPIQANTLLQHERINEREENKASKAGALHRLDQEPNDVARAMKKQGEALQARLIQAELERKIQEGEMVKSFTKIPKETKKTPKLTNPQNNPPNRQVRLVLEETSESSMLSEIEQQRSIMEQAIGKSEAEESGLEAEGERRDVPATPVATYKPPQNPVSEKPTNERRRGRKRLTEEVIQARLKEEKILRRERLGMSAEDKPGKKGRKMLTQEEIDRRKNQRELQKLQALFEEADTEGDY